MGNPMPPEGTGSAGCFGSAADRGPVGGNHVGRPHRSGYSEEDGKKTELPARIPKKTTRPLSRKCFIRVTQPGAPACKMAGVPGLTIFASFEASQFVSRIHPCDCV